MSQKSPQQLVEECEEILRKNGSAGIVVAMDSENGYYGLCLPKDSLFQWMDNDSKVKLSLAEATEEQVDEEYHMLKTLDTMLDYCGRAVSALVTLLHDATTPEPHNNGGKDKRYVN